MNKFQFTFGALVTLALNVILLLTVLGEQILTYGFIGAVLIIFAFVSIIKLAIGNAISDNKSVDWKFIGSFAFGSFVATLVVLLLGLAAIV